MGICPRDIAEPGSNQFDVYARKNKRPPVVHGGSDQLAMILGSDMNATLADAFQDATAKRHKFLTVEHLLLALLTDGSARDVLLGVGADLDSLRSSLDVHIEETTPSISEEVQDGQPQPSLGFQRALRRAVFHVQSHGRKEVTGADVLVAIFGEPETTAVHLLKQQNIDLKQQNIERIDIVKPIEGTGDTLATTEQAEREQQAPPEQAQPRRLGEMLVERNAVQQADIDRALQIQRTVGGRLGSLLVRTGAISEDALLRALAEQIGALYLADAEDLPDTMDMYRFMSESSIKMEWFLDNAVLMWRQGEDVYCLARDIPDHRVTETLEYFYQATDQAPDQTPEQTTDQAADPTADPTAPAIRFCLTANHHLDRALDNVRKERAMESLFAGEAQQLRDLAEQAPVIELVNNLLSQAVDLGASDIHVEPAEETFSVRMRLDGVLHTRLTQSKDRFAAVASRIKLISGLDIAERRLPQDGRITERISGREMDIRVSTVPCAFGESLVLRLLAKERDDLVFDNLGMEPDHLGLFRGWLGTTNGIVLVTGPTGSGKSTTLAAALEEIDDGVKKIITVEDPVEYQMPNITQMQVHSEIGFTFARALRAILRQDPDVIMIGEIRDLETAEIAIRSALTGHVVLSTVHTNDAISSFTRLVDMGVEPFLVAAPVRGVQAQRLVRRACPNCSVAVPRPALADGYLEALPAEMLGNHWVAVEGCDHCRHTGYRGRTGIYELVPMSEELQDMIVSGAHLNDLKRLAREQGYRTLVEDGLIKASRGETTVEELMRAMVIDGEAG